MRRSRVFRLGRPVVKLWRWMLRGRLKGYNRLDSASLRSPIRSNPISMTRNLITWGRRCLTRGVAGIYGGEKAALLEEKSAPPPKGHVAVYVGGGGGQRCLLPVIYFNHPLFGELLAEAEAEFGHHHTGGITIPCPIARFERVKTRIADVHRRRHHHHEYQEF